MEALRPPDAVLVVGGGPLHPAGVARAAGAALVVAADSGIDHALAAGLVVHHVVGDLDSASPEGVEAAVRAGAVVHPHELRDGLFQDVVGDCPHGCLIRSLLGRE